MEHVIYRYLGLGRSRTGTYDLCEFRCQDVKFDNLREVRAYLRRETETGLQIRLKPRRGLSKREVNSLRNIEGVIVQ